MSKVSYPAVFHFENNSYWVEFPDLEGCFSYGDTIESAFNSSKEALGLYLDQDDDLYVRSISEPSQMSNIIKQYPGEVVMLVDYDSLEYAKLFKNKAVKKTLSIPEWLNDAAIKENVNFSAVLQEALISKLNLK
ncbi:MAG: type II toxin-antitoxin system HicB family antitoxin [Faecalicoccus sp.]|nr:type II toxin-antitoxin system HicB family antitoxin [Faecalicoccus sp.]